MRLLLSFPVGLVIGFLFGMWFWWREYQKDIEVREKAGPIRPLKLHPMGALTFSYACIHCKHELEFNSQRCDRCMCEIESGFEPKSFEQEVPSHGREGCQKSD